MWRNSALIRCGKWAAFGILEHPCNCRAARSPQGPGLLSGGQVEPAELGQATHSYSASNFQAKPMPSPAPFLHFQLRVRHVGDEGTWEDCPDLGGPVAQAACPGHACRGFPANVGRPLDPPSSGALAGREGARGSTESPSPEPALPPYARVPR